MDLDVILLWTEPDESSSPGVMFFRDALGNTEEESVGNVDDQFAVHVTKVIGGLFICFPLAKRLRIIFLYKNVYVTHIKTIKIKQ